MTTILRNIFCICLCLTIYIPASATNDPSSKGTKNLAETFLDSNIGRLLDNVDHDKFESGLKDLIKSPTDSILIKKTFSLYTAINSSDYSFDSTLKEQAYELADFYEQQKQSGAKLSEYVRTFVPFSLDLSYYDFSDYTPARIYLKEAIGASVKDSYIWLGANLYLYYIAVHYGENTDIDIENILKKIISIPNGPLSSKIFTKIQLADFYYENNKYDNALEVYEELVNDLYNYNGLEYYAINNFLDIYITSLLKYNETKDLRYLNKAHNYESYMLELYEKQEKNLAIDFRIASNYLLENFFTADPDNASDIDDLVNATDNFSKYFHLYCHDKLPTLTTTERAAFYKTHIAPVIAYMPEILQLTQSLPVNLMVYQLLLDNRGLQLKCIRTFSDIINTSGTSEIKEIYDKYMQQKSVLEKKRNSGCLTPEQNNQLGLNIRSFEQQLMDWLKDKGHDILGWMNTYVDHIQNKLGPDEIALETFTYDSDDGDKIYCGLALANDVIWPVLFNIIYESDFQTLESTPQILGKVVWADFFENNPWLRRIYFVPCGRMVNFPIELCTDSLDASRDIEIVRLSSTREILDSDKKIPKKLHAFGVSEYNDDIFPDLSGARNEVKDVASLFPKNNRTIRIDGEATEIEFKNLSGSGAQLLHVAAHGYYNNPGNRAENALANCGLVLSEYANDDVDNEDGLLSGEEISTMNLGNVDLVTLSSCNSGNAVATEEGAYGLQRAFKLAGVKSILMSLREVKDDGPTKIFMHNFYRSYLSDGDKYKAYRKAVRAVRKRFSGIADWGAFVLIDP